nr:CPPV352 C-type lectin family protein [Cooks petrelpox virus]
MTLQVQERVSAPTRMGKNSASLHVTRRTVSYA